MCGMIKRSTGFHSPRNVQLSFYNTLVRSKIEYASPLWSSSHRCDIILVESVQRSFTKYVFKYTDISYENRCKTLNLLPLSYRREVNDTMVLFKLIQLSPWFRHHDLYTILRAEWSSATEPSFC